MTRPPEPRPEPPIPPDAATASSADVPGTGPRPHRMDIPALAGAFILALTSRMLGITRIEVWRDEAITLLHARASWRAMLTRLWWVEDSPPLGFLVFKAWSLGSGGETYMRLLSVLLGAAAVAVVTRTSQRMHAGSGVTAGLLFALSPVMLHYSQEIRAYSLLMLLTALAFWAAQRWRESPNSAAWIGATSLSAALAAHVHAVGLFVYPMVCAFAVFAADRRAVRQFMRPAGVWLWLLAVLPLLPYLHHWSHDNAQRTDWPVPRLDAWWLQYVASSVYGWHILESWTGGSPTGEWLAFAIERGMLILPACALAGGLLSRSARPAVAGLLAAAATGLLCFRIGQGLSVASFAERTSCVIWCPIVLAIGAGFAAIRARSMRRAAQVGLAVVTIVLSAAWVRHAVAAADRHPRNAEAFAWLMPRLSVDDLVFTAPAWFEDLVVYRIGSQLPGEAYFSPSSPVYTQQPPRHRMTARDPDPDWRDRLRRAVAAHRERGQPFSLWVIRYGSNALGEESPEHLLEAFGRPGDTWRTTDPHNMSVTELRLSPGPLPVTEPAPRTGA